MRRKLRQALFKEFIARAAEIGFEPAKARDPHQCRVHSESPRGLDHFVIIEARDGRESFQVDVAWSPAGEDPPGYVQGSLDDETEKGYILRLFSLTEPAFDDVSTYDFEDSKPLEWYETATLEELIASPPPVDELMHKIPDFLDEIFQQLREYGLPYFERVDQKYGPT